MNEPPIEIFGIANRALSAAQRDLILAEMSRDTRAVETARIALTVARQGIMNAHSVILGIMQKDDMYNYERFMKNVLEYYGPDQYEVLFGKDS